MTIARRLIILVAVPLATLVGIGVLAELLLDEIESHSEFVAQKQVESLASLGNISRAFTEMRVNLRSHLLADESGERAAALAAFEADEKDFVRLMRGYGDALIVDDRDRRLYEEYRALTGRWIEDARRIMSLANQGKRDAAMTMLFGDFADSGFEMSQVSSDWIGHNEELARGAGASAVASIRSSKRRMLLAGAAALVLTMVIGWLTYRSIVRPVRALEGAVRSIAGGRYSEAVPFLRASDETGDLARSIHVLKEGAAERELHGWVKSQVGSIAGELQAAATLEEFAQRLLSRLVPLTGGGIGIFYAFESNPVRLRRVTGFGLGGSAGIAETLHLGEGLAGQCASERRALTLTGLPPSYLKVSSALGEGAPTHAGAWPVASRDSLLGVIEMASFGEPAARERALLEELLPVAAMGLQILQRNLRTHELLEQMQQQSAELEKQQQTLRTSEERFRALIESAPDGLIISDNSGQIVLVNAQTERLLGYRREELIGRPIEILVPERVRARHPGLRRQYLASPEVRTMGTGMELAAVRKDGTEFPVDISLSPLRAPDGSTLVCSSLRDVTERKRMETELRLAMKKAEEATKAKSAFLANMSHEIRTPMNGIMGMTELALDTELTAEQRDYLNTVKSSADALLSIINDILDFSKIEAGKIELDPIEFFLRDSISDMLSPLAMRAGSKGLELAYDVDPAVPDALVGDVHRLRQVIVNLVGNAIKFTEKGEVVVAVGLVERTGDDIVLEVRVRDTGIGISSEAAARLFRPFEQAEVGTTRKFGGTGLGLAISRQLVELMGGQVRLESTPGAGSTFVFTVRVKAGTAMAPATAQDAARLFEGKSALIVDDNETNRRILATMLGHWGLRVIQADSARKALTALDRSRNAGQPASVLITDLHMPEMDGFELVAAVRAHPAFGLLPVVILTSSASPGDQERGKALGVAARLLKPIKQSYLLDHLVTIFSGAGRMEQDHDRAPDRSPDAASVQRPLWVLLAEDNAINQKFAERLLEGAGHKVTVASNGRQAADLCSANPFDVVLMDVQMPEMDGLDATREIRAKEAAKGGRIPIIAMTANAMAGDREMCLSAGMDGYISKPVRKEALFAEIGRVLGNGREESVDGPHV